MSRGQMTSPARGGESFDARSVEQIGFERL